VGRSFLWATHRCGALATYPKVGRTEPARAETIKFRLPSYLVLLRVWFALPATLLRRRCALTAPFHPYPRPKTWAVCFLWHFPSDGLEPGLPDVIRHTALRSSDFPLPASEDAGSDRPVQLPTRSLYAMCGAWVIGDFVAGFDVLWQGKVMPDGAKAAPLQEKSANRRASRTVVGIH
jgi:hypothetical protein